MSTFGSCWRSGDGGQLRLAVPLIWSSSWSTKTTKKSLQARSAKSSFDPVIAIACSKGIGRRPVETLQALGSLWHHTGDFGRLDETGARSSSIARRTTCCCGENVLDGGGGRD